MDNHSIRRLNLQLLKAKHVTFKALAEATDSDAAHLSQINTGNREMGNDVARRIENKLMLAHGWMDTLHLEDNVAQYNVEPARVQLFPWPVVSWVAAGSRTEAIEPYEPDEERPTVLMETEPYQDDIALLVKGDSMIRPDGSGFPSGCHIGVKTKRKAKSGDFVVVRFKNTDEATFKQYFLDGPVKLLKPLNPNWPTQLLPPDAELVGVVVEKRVVEKF